MTSSFININMQLICHPKSIATADVIWYKNKNVSQM